MDSIMTFNTVIQCTPERYATIHTPRHSNVYWSMLYSITRTEIELQWWKLMGVYHSIISTRPVSYRWYILSILSCIYAGYFVVEFNGCACRVPPHPDGNTRDVCYWPLLSFCRGNVAKLSVSTVRYFTLSVNHDCVWWLGLKMLHLSYACFP